MNAFLVSDEKVSWNQNELEQGRTNNTVSENIIDYNSSEPLDINVCNFTVTLVLNRPSSPLMSKGKLKSKINGSLNFNPLRILR